MQLNISASNYPGHNSAAVPAQGTEGRVSRGFIRGLSGDPVTDRAPIIQRDPKSFAKKNASQNGPLVRSMADIFSHLATILRSDW